MSGKYALIIGNTEYIDPGLAQLTAPSKDVEDFAHVLKDQEIGAFDDVNILLNQPESVIREAIDDFFNQKTPDDLLVFYFSGHGVKDDLGSLYLAVKNTNRGKLRSTALKSDFIKEAMDQSRSRRQVLILDCCNSGAFTQGTKAATGVSIGTASAFEGGYGRIILTASDSTQFAWEGDKVIGETDNSLFTHYLVEGLKGDADNDGDGRITVDELYDYAYEKVRLATPKQTPSKFSSKQQGEIVLRQSTRLEDIKSVALPPYLTFAIDNPDPDIRLGAVQSLGKLLSGKNIGLARSAKVALEKISTEDDSRRVSQVATQILGSIRQTEQKAKEEAERLAILKTDEARLTREKIEAERKPKEEAENLAHSHASLREAVRLEAEREAAVLAAAQKANEERIAKAKLETERLAEEKRLADQAEKERQAKVEVQRLADKKAEVELLSTQKANEERLAKAKLEAERIVKEKRLTTARVDTEQKAVEKYLVEKAGPKAGNSDFQKKINKEFLNFQDLLKKIQLNWMRIVGPIIILFGLIVLLQSIGYINNVFSFFWSATLIWIGLTILLQKIQSNLVKIVGMLLILGGLLSLLQTMNIISEAYSSPVLLVSLGLGIVWIGLTKIKRQ